MTTPDGTTPTPRKLADELHPALVRAASAIDLSPAMELVLRVMVVATDAPPADDPAFDERPEAMLELLEAASPEVRTNAAKLISGTLSGLERIRASILAVKSDKADPDVAHGDAAILPDGWLVVTMADVEIGRVPFNPERGETDASRMAEEILSEHVRLHVMGEAQTGKLGPESSRTFGVVAQ